MFVQCINVPLKGCPVYKRERIRMSASDVCTSVSIYVCTHQCKPLHLPTNVYIYTITYHVYPYRSHTVQMSAHVCTPCTKVTFRIGRNGWQEGGGSRQYYCETFTHSLKFFTHSLNFLLCSFKRSKLKQLGGFSCVRLLQSELKPRGVQRGILTFDHGWKMGCLFFPAHGLS